MLDYKIVQDGEVIYADYHRHGVIAELAKKIAEIEVETGEYEDYRSGINSLLFHLGKHNDETIARAYDEYIQKVTIIYELKPTS